MTILAIDQGTTSTRAVLVDASGETRMLLSLAHRQIYPRPGWVEHDPAELIANVKACLDAAAGIDGLAAVGIANQGESCLAWDAWTGRPAGPVIVWQDDRTAPETERLRKDGAEDLVRARSGLPLDPYFSASKLAWLLRENEEARALAKAGRLRLGTTDAFFRDRLTGRFETDVTTASRTSLMDLANCRWDEALCRLFGVSVEALPAITPTAGELGMVRVGSRDVPLTASVVDQQAALRGHACHEPGDFKITFGTGAFALALTGPKLHRPEVGPLPTLAWMRDGAAPVYALDAGVYAAASAVNWARSLGLFSEFSEVGAFDGPPAIARGLAFVPALSGLACPHWDRRAKGAWLGMTLDTSPRDLMQALLEGVAFRTAEAVAAIAVHQPLADTVPIDGGMSRNPWFCQFLADRLGRRVIVSREAELTALGAAALAAEGAGLALEWPRAGERIEPRPMPVEWTERFAAARRAVQGYAAGR